ncbi:hypothetical protein PCC9214_02465 [Planktothrix tepida]|uniref:hypothetical protein n=1 Tax=Planktothrix tepida TaxID=1678309 RepID=UPI00164654C2|nr:hypothetical protein [Planktothrix tepida]CAD5949594.1 hypothetical protein PCC9214_02465 [Planktothrix tepida]
MNKGTGIAPFLLVAITFYLEDAIALLSSSRATNILFLLEARNEDEDCYFHHNRSIS